MCNNICSFSSKIDILFILIPVDKHSIAYLPSGYMLHAYIFASFLVVIRLKVQDAGKENIYIDRFQPLMV